MLSAAFGVTRGRLALPNGVMSQDQQFSGIDECDVQVTPYTAVSAL